MFRATMLRIDMVEQEDGNNKYSFIIDGYDSAKEVDQRFLCLTESHTELEPFKEALKDALERINEQSGLDKLLA